MSTLVTREQAYTLLQKDVGENELVVFPPIGGRFFTQKRWVGRFKWTTTEVTFSYYSNRRIRTIHIDMKLLKRLDGSLASVVSFVPGGSWRTDGSKSDEAVLSEFAGTAHEAAKSTMVDKAAWNVINYWCGVERVRRGFSDDRVPLLVVMEWAEQAFAVVRGKWNVFYFMPPTMEPDPEQLRFRRIQLAVDDEWPTALSIEDDLPPDNPYIPFLRIAWDDYMTNMKRTKRWERTDEPDK